MAEPVKVRLEDLDIASAKPSTPDSIPDSLEFDLGNLLVFDPSPLSQDPDLERKLKSNALAPTRALLLQITRLPQPHSIGVVTLPPTTTPLPRWKPLPTAKPPTKWEAFALKKGIKKRKKERKIWDEKTSEWRRRFGFKRANDPKDLIILDAKNTDVPGVSPFEVLEDSRKDKIAKQNLRELQNLQRAVKGGAKLPETVKLSSQLPLHGKGHPTERRGMKTSLGKASKMAGISTASMGKFDIPLEGESKDDRISKSKKRSFVNQKETDEKSFIKKMTQKIVKENSEKVLNTEKAMGYFEAEKRKKRHQEKVLDEIKEDATAIKRQRSQKKKSTRNGKHQISTLPKMKVTTRQKNIKRRSRK